MKIIGIPLRKPSGDELTASVVMGVGLWVLAVGAARLLGLELGAADAGAVLVVMLWGSVSARLGIRIDQGRRHLLANVLVSAVLLAVYQGAWAFAV